MAVLAAQETQTVIVLLPIQVAVAAVLLLIQRETTQAEQVAPVL